MKLTRTIASILCVLVACLPLAMAQTVIAPTTTSTGGSALSFVAGKFVANQYSNYGGNYAASIDQGNAATGSSSITVRGGYIVLKDGRAVVPFAVNIPLVVSDANPELITPTSVSGCYNSKGMNQDAVLVTCTITASFTFLHGTGSSILSATGGAAEAMQDAFNWGGGIVVFEPGFFLNTSCTGCYSNFQNMMANLPIYPNVGFEDDRGLAPVYFSPLSTQAVGSYLAAPTTLVAATAFSSSTAACTPVGSCFAGGTIHVCIAYVDPMGNEGPCSGDYSFADTSAKAIQFTAPAASAGAVGWIPYIGLESGASGHEYQVPLVTQPTVLGNLPVSGVVCTLTTIETITPACAVTNTNYNQTGSAATATVYPVVTSPQALQLGGVSTTSYFAPNVNAHTTYAYEPGAHLALPSIISNSQPFTASAALASTVPYVLGTIALPPNYMNYQNRAIEICGQIVDAAGGVNTITAIQFYWDAQGSNVTTGIPVLIGGPKITSTTSAVAYNWSFCQTIETTVAAVGATGGSLRATEGFLTATAIAAGTAPIAGTNIANAAVGSLNLAENARIDIVYTQTTGTTPTPQLTDVTIKVLN